MSLLEFLTMILFLVSCKTLGNITLFHGKVPSIVPELYTPQNSNITKKILHLKLN